MYNIYVINNEILNKQKDFLIDLGVKFDEFNDEELEELYSYEIYSYKLSLYVNAFEKNKKKNIYIVNIRQLIYIFKLDNIIKNTFNPLIIDIEAILKIEFINEVLKCNEEEKNEIINSFLIKNPKIIESIFNKKEDSINAPYIEEIEDLKLDNIISFLSFGEFINLYRYFYKFKEIKNKKISYLNSIKFLRNAIAHDNTILSNIRINYNYRHLYDVNTNSYKITNDVNRVIKKIDSISIQTRKICLNNGVIHDLTALLILLFIIELKDNKKEIYVKQIKGIIDSKELKNRILLGNNNYFQSVYSYFKKVVDFLF